MVRGEGTFSPVRFGGWAGSVLLATLVMTGCGGTGSSSPSAPSGGTPDTAGPSTFTIGGTVSGLAAGAQLKLNDNGSDALNVLANGTFTFSSPVPLDGSFAVTV